MFRKVVLPIACSRTPEEIAARLNFIGQFGVRHMHLVHIMEQEWSAKRRMLDQLSNIAGKVKWDCEITLEVASGNVAMEICHIVDKQKADLIYLPGTCKPTVRTMLLGSEVQDIVRLCDIPVLVHKYRPSFWHKAYNTVLYATDFGEAAEQARHQVQVLGSVSKRLIIMHAGHRAADPISEARRVEHVTNQLESIRSEMDEFYAQTETVSMVGNPRKEIIETAERNQVDLIVMGRSNVRSMRTFVGSTAESVASRAACSVLIIP